MQARHSKLHGGVLAAVIPPPAEPSVIPLSETGGACGSSLSVAMMRDGRGLLQVQGGMRHVEWAWVCRRLKSASKEVRGGTEAERAWPAHDKTQKLISRS